MRAIEIMQIICTKCEQLIKCWLHSFCSEANGYVKSITIHMRYKLEFVRVDMAM